MKYLVIHELIVSFQLQLKILIHVISQKHLDKFFIQMSISMLKKNILLKNYFHLKDNKNYVGGLCIKMLNEIKGKLPPKKYKIYPKYYFFLVQKWHTRSVFSPCTKTLPFI
jgi:hypothetical protein